MKWFVIVAMAVLAACAVEIRQDSKEPPVVGVAASASFTPVAASNFSSCGNGTCETPDENCANCPEDCESPDPNCGLCTDGSQCCGGAACADGSICTYQPACW